MNASKTHFWNSTPTLRSKLLWMGLWILVDQATKWIALQHVRNHPPRIFWNNFFRIEYAENTGAFLGLGSSLSAETRVWIFTIAVGIFLIFATGILLRDRKMDWTSAFSLSAIVGGGVGNLIDRIYRENHGVVDFLNMGIGNFRTGIFNVADMGIMLGVILLAWKSFKDTPPHSPRSEPTQS